MRLQSFEDSSSPRPGRPYRDSAILYAVPAAAIVLLTGGSVVRAIVTAAVFFGLATAWTRWRFRERLRRTPE